MKKTSFIKIIVISILLLGFNLHFLLFALENDEWNYTCLFEKFQEKKKWQIVGSPLVLRGKDLINTNFEFVEYLMEFDVKDGFQWQVISKKDSVPVTITILQLPSQIMAFGLYSVEKSPSLKFFNIGFESYLLGNKIISWYGKFLLITEMSDTVQAREKLLREISEEVIKVLPEQKRATPILDALPEKNKVKHSEKFYLRRWLDQEYFENIYYADYYTPEGYSRMFIIDNKFTAVADSNFWHYYGFMKNRSSLIPEQLEIDTDYYIVNEPLWGKTLLAKKNQIIYGILDFRDRKWTEDRLRDLLNQLKKKKIVKSG